MMKVAKLRTYWEPSDAHQIILLLDEIRDALVEVYGDDIEDMYRQGQLRERRERPTTEDPEV